MTQEHFHAPQDDSADPPGAKKWTFGVLEAAGFRFEAGQRYFTIQHLATGQWARLEASSVPISHAHVPSWRLAGLLREAEYLPALYAVAAAAEPGTKVTAAELADLLMAAAPSAGDGPEAPPFPVPTVGQVFAYAYPENPTYLYRYPYSPYFRNLSDDVTAILAVATALAWRGGEALERDLRADLAALGWEDTDSRHALKLVAARTGSNVQRDARDRLWQMRRRWHEREHEAIERTLPPPVTINQLPLPMRRRPPGRES